MKADLHIHTTASDGKLTPAEVVDRAVQKGIDILAVTDHDTVGGIAQAEEAARGRGIGFVKGIEISAYTVCEIHILGYNIDDKDEAFLTALEGVQNQRAQRNVEIGKKLRDLGVKLDMDFAARGVGRMNIARAMVAQGFCRDTNEAFEKYLKTGASAYCAVRRVTPIEAIKMINDCGGFASLAHPKRFLVDGKLNMLVDGLAKFGLRGMEVNYPGHTDADRAALNALCRKYKLTATGGSDYHGDEDRDFAYCPDELTLKKLKIYR